MDSRRLLNTQYQYKNSSQKRILENIKKYLVGKTIIVIAHRLSTIKYADKIYVIDKSQVIEEGSHEELVEREDYHYNFLTYRCEILPSSLGRRWITSFLLG